jgi:hypothetical protein
MWGNKQKMLFVRWGLGEPKRLNARSNFQLGRLFCETKIMNLLSPALSSAWAEERERRTAS